MSNFKDLKTVSFQQKMDVHVKSIYKKLWPDCKIIDLRSNGHKAHILDQYFGIDTIIECKDGCRITIQEKSRENEFLQYRDFTQEYINGYGTINESPGEWFNLTAQIYFYGWANKDETKFEKWFIMDVFLYKMIIQKWGLTVIGKRNINKLHGRSLFYGIKLRHLFPAFVADYRHGYYGNDKPNDFKTF
jgi:hypothetical protein